jgi:hypothetical protein
VQRRLGFCGFGVVAELDQGDSALVSCRGMATRDDTVVN